MHNTNRSGKVCYEMHINKTAVTENREIKLNLSY